MTSPSGFDATAAADRLREQGGRLIQEATALQSDMRTGIPEVDVQLDDRSRITGLRFAPGSRAARSAEEVCVAISVAIVSVPPPPTTPSADALRAPIPRLDPDALRSRVLVDAGTAARLTVVGSRPLRFDAPAAWISGASDDQVSAAVVRLLGRTQEERTPQ